MGNLFWPLMFFIAVFLYIKDCYFYNKRIIELEEYNHKGITTQQFNRIQDDYFAKWDDKHYMEIRSWKRKLRACKSRKRKAKNRKK